MEQTVEFTFAMQRADPDRYVKIEQVKLAGTLFGAGINRASDFVY